MSAGGPVRFHVDLDALGELRANIRRLRDELADLGRSGIDATPGELGGVDVAGAVERFISGWADGRQQIEDNLYACELLIEHAVEEYTRAEASLSSGGRQ